jgi:hypothetical protein
MLPVKILTQVIAIAVIAGVVRLARRGVAVDYSFFAIVSGIMLVLWHFPPTERFVLPLFPLLAAGLVAELEHLAQMFRAGFKHVDIGQRAVAAILAFGFAAIVCGALGLQLFLSLRGLHGQAADARSELAEMRKTYAWIDRNTSISAPILSNDDPLLYLYTGHEGNTAPLLSRWWYAEDHEKFVDFFRRVAPYCRSRGIKYVLSTKSDMSRWTGDEDTAAVQQAMRENPDLEKLYEAPDGAVLYRVRAE